MRDIAIIIPAYNEKDNIEKLLSNIFLNVTNCTIYIIDDSTSNEVEKIIIDKKNVQYFHRKKKLGRGSAVLFGLKKAIEKNQHDIFMEMDADFSHDPKEIPRNIDFFLNNNLDLLIASRYMKKSEIVNWSFSRRIFSGLANLLARTLLRIKIRDFTNGFRIYSKNAAQKIVDRCGQIGDGFIILSEIIVVLKNNNFKIDEIETVFFNRQRGESSVNFKLIILSFIGLIKLVLIKSKLK